VLVGILLLAMRSSSADELIASAVSTIRLRAQAIVQQHPATLGDVLVLDRADGRLREAIADAPVWPADPDLAHFTHEQILERLGALGINRTRILVGGAAACHVTFEQPDPPAAPGSDAESAPLFRAVPASESSEASTSLAAIITAHVDRELASLGGKAEIDFERAGEPFLSLTSPPWDFDVRSADREKLGLRELQVTLRRDGRLQRKPTIMARVQMLKEVLVAEAPLNVGAVVRPQDVRVEPRLFERLSDVGLDDLQRVTGQHVKRFVAAGQMLAEADLQPVELVKRSRPVTVLGSGAGVRVNLTGTALDSGNYGEPVRVRLGETRRDQRVVRGIVSGLGTVQLQGASQ
jgi:flagella basal body P-ring formation protein FlgA